MSDPVVIDTHVFNRAVIEEGEFRDVYEKLLTRCDRVLVTQQIIEEYTRMAPRAGISATFILGEIIPYLRLRGKWEPTANQPVAVGSAQDRRFIGAALGGGAPYIVSNDPGFKTRPVRSLLKRSNIRVLSPRQYTRLPDPSP